MKLNRRLLYTLINQMRVTMHTTMLEILGPEFLDLSTDDQTATLKDLLADEAKHLDVNSAESMAYVALLSAELHRRGAH